MSAITEGKSEPGAAEFLKSREAKGTLESTLRCYCNHIGIVRRRSPVPLLELSEDQARDTAIKLTKLDSGSSIAITIRMFLSFHGKDDIAKIFRIRKKKKRLNPKDILTIEDVNTMIRACDSLRDRALVALLWESGGRIHELLALDLGDVSKFTNGEEEMFKVFFKKVKVEGEEHSCLLIEATSHLKAWTDAYPFAKVPDSPLFPALDHANYGARLNDPRHVLKKIIERAGIKKRVYPHLFRHSRATHLLRVGTSEAIVKKLLGWAPNSQMLGKYSHLVDQDVDNAILQAHGREPVKPIEIGGLLEATGDLEPVLPIATRTEPLVIDEKAIVEKLFEKVMESIKKDFGDLHKVMEKEVRKQVKE